MKFFLKFLIVAFIAYVTPVMAQLHSVNYKMYIDLARLEFSEEGIFVKDRNDQLVSLKHISCDSEGYYITEVFDFLFHQALYEAKCKDCGQEYQNRVPQPCESCGKSYSFDMIRFDKNCWFEDDWFENEIYRGRNA